MFGSLALSVFDFLVKDFGFEVKIHTEKSVRFEKGGCFIDFSHSQFDEVCLKVGVFGVDFERGFDASSVAVLDPSRKVNLKYDEFASNPESIERALEHLAGLLLSHGGRVLSADLTVFDEMKLHVERCRINRIDQQTRQLAEKAFSDKNFHGALDHYRSLEERKTPIDIKRMEICERHLRER